MLPVCYSELGTEKCFIFIIFVKKHSRVEGNRKVKPSKLCNRFETSRTKSRSFWFFFSFVTLKHNYLLIKACYSGKIKDFAFRICYIYAIPYLIWNNLPVFQNGNRNKTNNFLKYCKLNESVILKVEGSSGFFTSLAL